MKVTVKVGEVALVVSGLDLTRREIRRLLMDCAGIAAGLSVEEAAANPIGFSVITERGTDPPEEHLFTDDEEWGS